MNLVASVMILFSVLMPTKLWYAPSQPVEVKVGGDQPVRLVAIDLSGKKLEAKAADEVAAGQTVDVKSIFPQIAQPGTYVLLAVPNDGKLTQFVGTPMLIQARTSGKLSGPIATNVIRVSPLVYANMHTSRGDVKVVFWFDAAPNTAAAFINLSEGGFYDGLSFHRVVPGFVIQGGDPTGTGFGGPGYQLHAEFSDRPHEEGVLSMARTGDPLEAKGLPARPEFANSAGSQFFICLSRERCQTLDKKYTAFGRVVEGMDAVRAIAAAPLDGEKPLEPQIIQKVDIVPVTAKDNPYMEALKLEMLETEQQTTAPSIQPAE